MKIVPMKCRTHPRYQAKRAPRCLCEPCWRIWIDKQDSQPERTARPFLNRRGVPAYETPYDNND